MTINYHYNRRNRNFLNRKVSEALPEHITSDFTKFVDFLETYLNIYRNYYTYPS